jgi:hypothetical protein
MTSNPHATPPSRPILLLAPALLPRRLLLSALVTLLLLLGLGHTLLWSWLGGEMQRQLASWVAARQALGWHVEHGTPLRGGWPWAAQLTVPAVRVVEPGGIGWRGESLALRLALPWPRHLTLAAEGEQAVLAGAESLPFSAGSLTGSVPLGGQPLRLQAQALQTDLRAGQASLRRAALVLAEGNAFDLALEGLVLPGLPPAMLALGPEVQRLVVQAALAGPPPPLDGRAPQATAWRDGGGRLELRAFDLLWGPVQAGAQGDLTLDAGLQPVGRLTLALLGFSEALDALVAGGVMAPNNARGLRAVGMLLQRVPAEGGPPRLQLPLVLRDRAVSAAGFTLLRLPPMVWSQE